jgi:hypothetical protein
MDSLEQIVEEIYFQIMEHLAEGLDADDVQEIKDAIRKGLEKAREVE